MSSVRPRGSFGIDAPWVPWMRVVYAVIYAVLTVFAAVVWYSWPILVVTLGLVTVLSAAGAAVYWHTSGYGRCHGRPSLARHHRHRDRCVAFYGSIR